MVDGADGFIGPLGRDDHGDIPLRGTLGGGTYRDAVAAQGGQHAAGGAAVAQHIVPDDADNGKAFFHAQRIQFPEGNFVGEASIGRPPGFLGVGCGNGDAHGVHGRGLRDEDDVDAGAGQGVKEAGTEARYAHHAAAFQRNKCQAMGVGNADGAPLRPRRIFLHQRAWLIRMEGVFYINGNALCHNGLDGGRVNYLGAKMGKLLRGAVGDMRNGAGRRHHLRMGGHDARNIGPNLYPAGVDAHGEQRRGVVRAAAPEGGYLAVLVACNEARDNEQFRARMLLNGLLHAPIGLRAFHHAVPHADNLAGVQPSARNAL